MSTYQDVAKLFLADVAAPVTPEMQAAVMAWTRQESGGQILRNNPWNLHGTKGDYSGLAIGDSYAGPGDVHVAIFAKLIDGVRAAVINLASLAPQPWTGYQAVLDQARTGNALGFLNALAASAWSAGRYGTKNGGPNNLLPLYQAALKEITVTATTPKIPTSITATEPVMLGAGLVTALVYMLQAAGIITVPEAHQLGPQLNAAIVTIWPLVIMVGGIIGRHFASSPATVAQIAAATSTPQVTAPVTPPPAPVTTSTGSTHVALTVISSTDLPAGTEGSIAAGTRRWSLDGERLSDVGPAIVELVAIDNVSGDTNNGHFYRTGTNPPYRMTMGSVSLDAPLLAAPAPVTPAPVVSAPIYFSSKLYGDEVSAWEDAVGRSHTPDEWHALALLHGGQPFWAKCCAVGLVGDPTDTFPGADWSLYTAVYQQGDGTVYVWITGKQVGKLTLPVGADLVAVAKTFGIATY